MRALLACLLCFVLLESQALAVHTHGDLGNSVPVVGTYSGVLLPPGSAFLSDFAGSETSSSDSTSSDTTSTDSTLGGANSIGVFNLAVPDTGLATGAFLAFSGGRVFTGTIDGLADPDTDNLLAVLQATFDFTISVSVTSTTASSSTTTINSVPVTATLTGSLQATIVPPTLDFSTTAGSLARLIGTAHLDVNFGNVDTATFAPIISDSIDFIVDGFKQSETAVASGVGTATGGGGTGTTGG